MPDVWREVPDSHVFPAADRVIGEMAAAQWGVVARRQLTAAGLTRSMIEVRLARGQLTALHHGVYAVGHRRLRRDGWRLAAVLAVRGAVLSHRDAAGLHGLRPANHVTVDVTTTGRAQTHQGIRVHRTRVLDAEDVTTVDGMPVTTVARTLVDLANVVPKDHLAKAMREAEIQHQLDVRALEAVMQRTRGRRGPGHQATRETLAELAALATTLTRSSLEVSFQRLVQRHRLPKPQTNVDIEGMQVDVVWPKAMLIVELDGWQHHGTKHAFQGDRERDVRLQLAGYRVLRFTHDDVVRRSQDVADAVRVLLDRAPAPAAAI